MYPINLDIYFLDKTFGTPVQVWDVSGSGSSYPIQAIFDWRGTTNTLGTLVYINENDTLTAKTSDVVNVTNKSCVVVDGLSFKVVSKVPETTGTTIITLTRDEDE